MLDSEECWATALVEEGLAEMFIPIDFEEQEGLFERVLAAIRQVEEVRACLSIAPPSSVCMSGLCLCHGLGLAL